MWEELKYVWKSTLVAIFGFVIPFFVLSLGMIWIIARLIELVV